jgi:N-acetylneuraminic acid mutarotase
MRKNWNKKIIDEIFEKTREPKEYTEALYSLLYGQELWPTVGKIIGYPRCGKAVYEYINKKVFEIKPVSLFWFNYGFSYDGNLGDWTVKPAKYN